MVRALAATFTVLAIIVILFNGKPAWAGTAVVPSTTLALETGNNTSTANSFGGQSNGNPGPGNVSKVDTHSLLYAGATTKIYAHVMPWWGSSSHTDIGYNSNDPAQAQRQVADIASRGMDGAVVDWYGPGSYEDPAAKVFMAAVLTQPNFTFAVEIEHGGVLWHSCYPTCDATTAFINLANEAAQIFYSSPAYVRLGGRPVLLEFNMAAFTIDWNKVQSSITGNPLIIHYNPPGFSTTATSGAFGWMEPKTLDTEPAGYDGSPYLSYFYKVAGGYPALHTFGSSYKGFNDTIASWAPTGGRHIEQNCGQTWLKTFAIANTIYSPANPLESLQIVTWNDYEEGTEIETGIDNCLSIAASASGSKLQWTVTGDESTLDHYTVFISSDGQNLMPVADFAAGTHAVDLAVFGFDPGAYKVFVKAVGKPSIRNHVSAAVSYTAGFTSTSATSGGLSVSTSPGMVTVTRGNSGQMSVSVTGSGGFSGQVALSCGDLPGGVACSFSPAILNAGTSAGTTMLTVSAPLMAMARPGSSNRMLFAAILPGAFGLVVLPAVSRKRRALALLFVVLSLMLMTACGGSIAANGLRSSSSAVKAGTYTFTITATSGNVSRSTTAKLVIK